MIFSKLINAAQNGIKRIIVVLIFCSTIYGCEKEIIIEVPDSEIMLVVEGRIEGDGLSKTPPFVLLSRSSGYFEVTSIADMENLQVHNAVITVRVDNIDYPLEEICISNLPQSMQPLVAAFLDIGVEDLAKFNYCFYTVPAADLLSGNYLYGIPGKTYYLTIKSEGITYTSKTKIPDLIPLSSVWFDASKDDTLGFAWAHLEDPDTSGDAYRWYARRLGLDFQGNPKDDGYLPPAGSAFEDEFFNGKSFDFGYDRGHLPGEHENEDPAEVTHYFKSTDTIAIKFCTIDLNVYRFLRVYEIGVNSAGSPFASPSTIPTNIEGGALGLWAGYGVTYDTIFGVK